MSTFDAKVLAWANAAKVTLDHKADLLERSLKSISDYEKLGTIDKMNVKVDFSLKGDIEKLRRRVEGEMSSKGGDEIDEEVGFQNGQPKANDLNASIGKLKVGFEFGAVSADVVADEEEEEGEESFLAKASTTDDKEHEKMATKMKTKPSRRKTVSSEVINLEDIDNFTPPTHEKSQAETDWLFDLLESNYLFEHLEHHELQTLINAMVRVRIPAGSALLNEGDDGDTFYIIENGSATVSQAGETVKTVGEKACLGEEDLMYSAEIAFTVVADEDLACWSLDRQTYRYIVTKASIKKRAMYEDFLSKIDFLKSLTAFERLQVADALKPTEYKDGEKIISFGEEGTHFHIIVNGEVKVLGRQGNERDGEVVEVCSFTVGDCVGELEFINKHCTVADIIAVGDVKTAKMGRRHFEKVMGPVEEFLKDRAKGHEKYDYYRKKQLQDP